MNYCTANDLILRVDSRTLGDLLNDSGQRVNPFAFASSPIVTAIITDASSIIDASVLAGGRYTTAQLAALTPPDNNLLVLLCVRLAVGLLYLRRGQEPNAAYHEAQEILSHLRQGIEIFPVPGIGSFSVDQSQYLNFYQSAALNQLQYLAKCYPLPTIMPQVQSSVIPN